MSENTTKSWERPWTTQEMIEKSSDWSLAGDAGLLKYLEEFSEKLLSKAKETTDRLDNLGENITNAHLSLANIHNEFMGLHNTQFIESRAYEDDETLPEPVQPEKEVKPKPTEVERLEEMKQAILNGLEIVDKYYEKVEIPASDSEDDTDEPSAIFQPIDPYNDRPLPYVIGTSEWHKYWHVGLLESPSDSDVEDQREEFSDSESEQKVQNLPTRDRSEIPGISDNDSEQEVIRQSPVSKTLPAVNENDIIFESSSNSDTGSAQVNIRNTNSFAAELAAKLGKVENDSEPEVNKRPIQKEPRYIGGLFSAEPPPLDDEDTKPITQGIFSGGDGLFDDGPDTDSFWTSSVVSTKTAPVASKSVKNVFANDKDEDIFSKKKVESPTPIKDEPKKQTTGGLFDDNEDDSLFSTMSSTPIKSLFSDQPPDTEQASEIPKKKLAGIKSPFGNNNSLLNEVEQAVKRKELADSKLDTEKSNAKLDVQSKEVIPKTTETKKIIESLFDDDSSLFTDDIFSSNTNFTSGLFGTKPDEPSLFSDDFSSDSAPTKVKRNPPSSLLDTETPSLITGYSPKSQPLLSESKSSSENIVPKEQLSTSSVPGANQIYIKDTSKKQTPSLNASGVPDMISPTIFSDPLLESNLNPVSHGSMIESTNGSKTSKPSELPEAETVTSAIKPQPPTSLFASEPPDLNSDTSSTNQPHSLESEPDFASSTLMKKQTPASLSLPESSISSDISKKQPSTLFSSEPPPLDESRKSSSNDLNFDYENDLLSVKSESQKLDNPKTDAENELRGESNKVSTKLSEGREDLFSDSFATKATASGLFDWGPPELDQPPSLNNVSDRSETKKSVSSLFSDEEDLFDTSTKSSYTKNSLWSQEPPPLDNYKSESTEPKVDLFANEDDIFKLPSKEVSKSSSVQDTKNKQPNKMSPTFPHDDLFTEPVTKPEKQKMTIDLFANSPEGNISEGKTNLFSDDKIKPEKKIEKKSDFSKSSKTQKEQILFSDDEDLFIKPQSVKGMKNREESSEEKEPVFYDEKQNILQENKESKISDPLLSTENNEVLKNKGIKEYSKKISSSVVSEERKQLFSDSDDNSPLFSDITFNTENKFEKHQESIQAKKDKENTISVTKKEHSLFSDDEDSDFLFSKSTKDVLTDKNPIITANRLHKNGRNSTTDVTIQSKTLNEQKSLDPLSSGDSFAISVEAKKKKTLFSGSEDIFQDRPKVAVRNTEALANEDSQKEKPSLLLEKNKKNEQQTKSLFSDEEDTYEKPQKTNQPKTDTSLFSEDSDDDLFGSKSWSSKPAKKYTAGELMSNTPTDIKTTSGKIKHNLNINVSALLPGAAPKKNITPKSETPEKKDLDETKSTETKEVFPDSPIENVDILTSAAKQRVRPAKRRPSTRRARQEAIRKSGMEFNFEDPTTETEEIPKPNIVSPTESEKNIQNVVNNNPMNIFSDNIENSSASNEKKNEEPLFKDDSVGFFQTKKTTRVEKEPLFGDEDEDDDIFNNLVASKPSLNTSTGSSSSNRKQASRIKKLTPHSDDTIINDPLDVINK